MEFGAQYQLSTWTKLHVIPAKLSYIKRLSQAKIIKKNGDFIVTSWCDHMM